MDFENIYHTLVNAVMIIKLLILAIFFMVLLVAKYFRSRPRWRIGFLIGCALTMLALGGDLMDGSSDIERLHLWVFFRHVGIAVMLGCALGMHWDKFSRYLFRDSRIFSRFDKSHKNDGDNTDVHFSSGGHPPPPPPPPSSGGGAPGGGG